MQCPRFNKCEISDQSSELGYVLDAANQIRESGIVLLDHRCAFRATVIHEYIHLVPRKRWSLL